VPRLLLGSLKAGPDFSGRQRLVSVGRAVTMGEGKRASIDHHGEGGGSSLGILSFICDTNESKTDR
jgi:hypothetical protein